MRILLTGRRGQVGSALARELRPLGHVDASVREDMDLSDPDAVVRRVRESSPDLIVNAAAWTAVDRAESEPEACHAVNATGPAVLAEEAARRGIPIVHYSTDYVFDGRGEGAYREEDPPAPISVYGRSKLAGEEAVRASGAPHLVLRIAWVYGARSRSFLTTMLSLFGRGESVRVVEDEVGAPTWCVDVARATARILGSARAEDPRPEPLVAALAERGGVYHLAPSGETSWYGFAQAIAALARYEESASGPPEIVPIPASEWVSAAARPRNSRLDAARIREAFGVSLGPWRDRLVACLAESDLARPTAGRVPCLVSGDAGRV